MRYLTLIALSLTLIAAAGFFSALRPGECQSYYADGDIYTVCVLTVYPTCQAEIFTGPVPDTNHLFGTAVIEQRGWIDESDILPRMYCYSGMLQLSSHTKPAVTWAMLPVVKR